MACFLLITAVLNGFCAIELYVTRQHPDRVSLQLLYAAICTSLVLYVACAARSKPLARGHGPRDGVPVTAAGATTRAASQLCTHSAWLTSERHVYTRQAGAAHRAAAHPRLRQ
jgi:hypothetical protein